MDKQRSFGWRVNGGADGFEQSHGRFTMEVFFNEVKRVWTWFVWAGTPVKGNRNQTIVERGSEELLSDAKKSVLRAASALEREALMEDKKFR